MLNVNWTFTAVYGPTEHQEKILFWRELRQIRASFPGPWLIGGDFSATYKVRERNGTPQSTKISKAFTSLIRSLQLIDPPLEGQDYTWSNHRESPTMAKLDRLLFSPEWDDIFPHAIQIALLKRCSDHSPIKLSLVSPPNNHRPFRFDRRWLGHANLAEVVEDAWQSSGSPEDAILNLVLKIRATRKALKVWSHNVRRATHENKDKLLHQIQDLDKKEEQTCLSSTERDPRDQHKRTLFDLYKLEEIYWKQRSKVNWITY
ncbi:uncharacterized protein [Elaeis guineensis]|uniref:uncharacterized protein n=1 Tax=Elaeis guineensis var. tenera TaxID=51953 RepID=UPI003C6D92AC